MGTGLLTAAGFDPKRMADIVADKQAAFKILFGENVDLRTGTLYGDMIAIQSADDATLWELLEEIYNSQIPDLATGASLDGVMEITNVTRNPATRSIVTLYLRGGGVTVPQLTKFETSDTKLQFELLADAILPVEVVLSGVTLSQSAGVATAVKTSHGRSTGDWVWVLGATPDAYNGVHQITVTDSSHFTYPIASGTASPATGSIEAHITTPAAAQSVDTGPVGALAGTLTSIVNAISGLDAASNFLDAELGSDEESDADARLRRIAVLAGLGNAALEAIRGDLLQVLGVSRVFVFENTTDATVSGRPPHSIECVVDGTFLDQDVLDALFASKAAGIETYGTTSGTVVDSQGISHTVKFTKPASISIYVTVTFTKDDNVYPSDGDDRIVAEILKYGQSLDIGNDVVVFPYLVGSFIEVAGIVTATVAVGTAPTPTLSNNITIAETDIAVFDSSRIIIVTA